MLYERTDTRRIGWHHRQTGRSRKTHGGFTESMVWPAGMGSVLRTSLALVPMLLAPHFDADADSREAAARESEALQLSMVPLQFWDRSAEEFEFLYDD